MKNILVLARYASKTMLEKALDKAKTEHEEDVVYFIVKENKIDKACDLIRSHQKKMKGVVCDLLWEAVTLDQNLPLELVTLVGFVNLKDSNIENNVDIQVRCDESSLANFKFSSKELLEVRELAQNEAYQVTFRKTSDFVASAKKIILANKANAEGSYSLNSVLNQNILERKNIEILSGEYSDES